MNRQRKTDGVLALVELYRRIIDDRYRSITGFGRPPVIDENIREMLFQEAQIVFAEITGYTTSVIHKEIAGIINDNDERMTDIV